MRFKMISSNDTDNSNSKIILCYCQEKNIRNIINNLIVSLLAFFSNSIHGFISFGTYFCIFNFSLSGLKCY